MKISYNWLKWYLPQIPEPQKLSDVFTYHLAEVESLEKRESPAGEDWIFDVNILPNRAHDLLSHQGIAREISRLLKINFVDPTPKYKVPESRPTNLEIKTETEKCRRYMGRIIRNVKVGPSPDWMKEHLEAIGQRSINSVVDAANIVMYDCGQPTHAFDLNKLHSEKIIIRLAENGEEMTTLDNKEVKFSTDDMVIADDEKVLAIAGVKGGKLAEVDANTTDIVLEVANFEPTSVRKTAQRQGIFTDARKRFENDLSPELAPFAMQALTALILEVCPEATVEEIVDIYKDKPKERVLPFSSERISKILGLEVSAEEVEEILKQHDYAYTREGGDFEIIVPVMRLDLVGQEDMAEEIARIVGYDRVKPEIPKINFAPKENSVYLKMTWARNKLLGEGYSETITYSFTEKGEREVLESASDKKFLRANLSDGLKESARLNQLNAPFFGVTTVKVFEIGTVFLKDREEMRVAYGDQKKITEVTLDEFCNAVEGSAKTHVTARPPLHVFKMWSLYPFISRDIAVWIPESQGPEKLETLLRENGTDLLVKNPQMFDSFTKDGRTSYAFRLVFQSYDRTLTDAEVNQVMEAIVAKIKDNSEWEIR
ncbi:MAG TPA: phenylalanine--tRNA ligase subunit beta [Candidatus Paceibacterota bacterium]|nr:phenylalanine--tRNA ligase subunit beta [Candidatus Paceibacterota bacterium]